MSVFVLLTDDILCLATLQIVEGWYFVCCEVQPKGMIISVFCGLIKLGIT